MRKKLLVLALSMLGVAAALSVGAPAAEASTYCSENCTTSEGGEICCHWCCVDNGFYYCSGPLICYLG